MTDAAEDACPFCGETNLLKTAAAHVQTCLVARHEVVIGRDLGQAQRANMVRVQTAGPKLMTSEGKPYALEIPVDRLTCRKGALQSELKARLHCLLSHDPRSFTCDGISNGHDLSRLHARDEP